MKKYFIKERKIENALLFTMCIFLIIEGLYLALSKHTVQDIYILNNYRFGIPFVIIGIVGAIFTFITLIKKDIKNIYIIKRIVYFTILIIVLLFIFDFIILGMVRSFQVAKDLTKKDYQEYSLMVRMAYIWLNNFERILRGVGVTLILSLVGTLVGFILGLLFVSLRTLEITPRDSEIVIFLKKIGRGFVKIYVTVLRGTPMMVQGIIIFYFLPGVLAGIFKVDIKVINQIFSVFVAGLITVSLNTTAYITEVLRGGIESMSKGQLEAARSLGMSRTKAMFYVILPQGIKNSLPAICNEFIINIKDTSVLSVIQVVDLFFVINQINGQLQNQDAIFIAAAIYLILTYGISKLLGLVEKKMNLVAKPLPSSN